MATGHRYSGINVLVLGMHPAAFQTGHPRFCTCKQAQEDAWQVKGGEHGTTASLYKPLTIEDEKAEGGEKVIPLLKTFTVFHPTQMDGVPPFVPPKVEECPRQSEEAMETIIRNSGVTVRIGGDRAFYSPSTDHVQIPPSVAFRNAAEEAAQKGMNSLTRQVRPTGLTETFPGASDHKGMPRSFAPSTAATIFGMCGSMTGHEIAASDTIPMFRVARFC